MHCKKKLRNILIFFSMLIILITGCAPSKRADGGGTIIGNPEIPAFDHKNPAADPGNQQNPIVASKKESNQKNSRFPSFGFALDPNNPLAVKFIWKSVEGYYEIIHKEMPTGDIQNYGIMIETPSEAEQDIAKTETK